MLDPRKLMQDVITVWSDMKMAEAQALMDAERTRCRYEMEMALYNIHLAKSKRRAVVNGQKAFKRNTKAGRDIL